MADADTVRLDAWVASLPPPQEDSRWDVIFLAADRDRDFGVWLAWYCKTFVDPSGEMHHMFLAGEHLLQGRA